MEQSVQLAEKQLGSKHLKKIISSIPIPSFFTVSLEQFHSLLIITSWSLDCQQ